MNYDEKDLDEKETLREGTLRSIVRSILFRHRDKHSEGLMEENEAKPAGKGRPDSGPPGRASGLRRMQLDR